MFGYYWDDNDGDGLGGGINQGYRCSSDAAVTPVGTAGIASNPDDIDEGCHCPANTDAACYDCLGNCKYSDNGTVSSDFIGDDSGKTNACSDTSRLGCDACGVCNGVVPTWYKDADADGFGDSGNTTSSCTLPSGYTNDNSDIDDSCYCLTNSAEAYTNGGLCKDDTGKCGGDGYTANCTDIDYIIGNYSSTMTCVDMDCDGQATTSNGGSGTDVFGYYFTDKDGDGVGLANKGYRCSSDAEGLSVIPGDRDDNLYCESNLIDECSICDGANIEVSSCQNPLYENQIDCEASLETWNVLYEGPDIDCGGFCDLPDTLKAELDECSGFCCGGYTGVPCSYYNHSNDFGGEYDCLGECGGIAQIDDCGICNGNNVKNSIGNCVFTIYPGDTDMNGSVNLSDLNPIVSNWGGQVPIRSNLDLNGSPINSKSKWIPQGQEHNRYYLNDPANECILYADANGDGLINIFDVSTVFKNTGKSHNVTISNDCSSPARESDIDIYKSIFESLSNGELKKEMAIMYGFEIPPEKFIAYSNYPNPFNPITNINYELPEKGNVMIEIHNIIGQQVTEYIGLDILPGYYSFTWDASNFPSGIYYYRIFYNNILIQNKKMALVK